MVEREFASEKLLGLFHNCEASLIISDRYVGADGVHAAGNRPDMNVMHVENASQRFQGGTHLVDIEIPWSGFQQHVNALAKQ